MSNSSPSFLSALERLFEEGIPLVFWNDASAEFSAQVDDIAIDGVKVLRLDRLPAPPRHNSCRPDWT